MREAEQEVHRPWESISKAQCVGNGDETLPAVMNKEGATTFYQLEQGKYKRSDKNWLDYIGNRVEVTGSTGTDLAMLLGSIFLLIVGAGVLSIDARLAAGSRQSHGS